MKWNAAPFASSLWTETAPAVFFTIFLSEGRAHADSCFSLKKRLRKIF
jgi:hypothetical protein